MTHDRSAIDKFTDSCGTLEIAQREFESLSPSWWVAAEYSYETYSIYTGTRAITLARLRPCANWPARTIK